MTVVMYNPGAVKYFIGVSGDVKPTTNVPVGSFFLETDTGVTMIYNGSVWSQASDGISQAVAQSGTWNVGLSAGEAYVGKAGSPSVEIRGVLNAVSPGVIAAAGDYAAGDVLSHATSSGGVWTFPAIGRVANGTGYIVRATLTCSVDAATPRMRLWLFKGAPTTTETDDNDPFNLTVADRALFLGKIDFPALVDAGTCSVADNPDVRQKYICSGTPNTTLWGILQTLDAFTNEAASMTIDMYLQADQD